MKTVENTFGLYCKGFPRITFDATTVKILGISEENVEHAKVIIYLSKVIMWRSVAIILIGLLMFV
ncbi:hypothetical protein ATY38_10730 [Nitrosomonas ureae]|nr:hypothetical protein ATY38_09160 [Nitrosomonas ureae]ALQ51652.1 hypothetical protein ATY38_10730 [Nitrosomonas ureae]